MKIRSLYFLLLFCLHVTIFVLSFQFIPGKEYLFFLIEALLLLTLVASVRLYRLLLRPVNLISAGVETIREHDFTITLRPTGQKEVDSLIEVYNLMIEQLRKERVRQQEQHFFLEKLIDASPSGTIIYDLDGRISTANQAALTILGLKASDLMSAQEGTQQHKNLSLFSELVEGEAKLIPLDGARLIRARTSHFIDRGFPRQFVVFEEVTRELHQSEKQAYDRVIRMISHEVNNSTGAVNSLLQSCQNYARLLKDEDRQDFMNALEVSLERNLHMNRFIRNFADVVRLQAPLREQKDCNMLLERVARLMRFRSDQSGTIITLDLAPKPLLVSCDESQMEQVLVNLITNALEAIEHGGEIVLQSNHTPPSLIIQDNGPGIPAHIQQQLFTPFFSTKKEGQGIGLTLVREILLNHEFGFTFQTDQDGLTRFTIFV